jgi:hypothetical protein
MNAKKEKNERTKKIMIGIIVTIFMVSSIAAVVLYRADDTTTYNPDKFTMNLSNGNYEFTRKLDTSGNAYYDVSSSKGKFTSYFLPSQYSDMKIDKESISILKNSNFYYLSFDPEQEGLTYTDFIRFNMRQDFPAEKYFLDSVTSPSTIYDFPVVDCINATSIEPVVVLTVSNSTNITSKNNCVHINFIQYDTLRVRDLLIYSARGIDIN